MTGFTHVLIVNKDRTLLLDKILWRERRRTGHKLTLSRIRPETESEQQQLEELLWEYECKRQRAEKKLLK